MGRDWSLGGVHWCVGAGGGGVCIRGFWIGGRGALSVLGGFIAQSTCKCVVRKLVVYLVH